MTLLWFQMSPSQHIFEVYLLKTYSVLLFSCSVLCTSKLDEIVLVEESTCNRARKNNCFHSRHKKMVLPLNEQRELTNICVISPNTHKVKIWKIRKVRNGQRIPSFIFFYIPFWPQGFLQSNTTLQKSLVMELHLMIILISKNQNSKYNPFLTGLLSLTFIFIHTTHLKLYWSRFIEISLACKIRKKRFLVQ